MHLRVPNRLPQQPLSLAAVASPAWFRAIVEMAPGATPGATVIADRGGHTILVNGQTEAILGCAREELLGEPVERLIPERFHPAHQQHRGGEFP